MDICPHCDHPISCHEGRCLVQVGGRVCECTPVARQLSAQMHGDGRLVELDPHTIEPAPRLFRGLPEECVG